jgi:O-antigen ligase
MGITIAFLVAGLAAAAVWVAVIATSPGDSRRRSSILLWFLIPWTPFLSTATLLFGFDITSLPVSAITTSILAVLALTTFAGNPKRRVPKVVRPLVLACVGLWLVLIFCDLGAGLTPGLRALSGGVALVIILITLDETNSALTGIRLGLASLTVGSLAVGAFLRGAWVVDTERFPMPLPPPFPGRLAGLTFHPNALGYIAGMLILLEVLGPKRRVPSVPLIGIATLALLYSGSRSALVGLVAAAVVSFVVRRRKSPIWWAGALAGLVAGIEILVYSTNRGGQVSTLNGRQVIWDAVLNSFQSRPIFGFGPGGWENLVAAYHLPRFAVEGHNQVIDMLGKGGLVGLLGLAIWLAVAVWTVVKVGPSARVLPAAVLAFVAGRSILEVPLDVYYLGAGTITAAVFAACAAWNPLLDATIAEVVSPESTPETQGFAGARHEGLGALPS